MSLDNTSKYLARTEQDSISEVLTCVAQSALQSIQTGDSHVCVCVYAYLSTCPDALSTTSGVTAGHSTSSILSSSTK